MKEKYKKILKYLYDKGSYDKMNGIFLDKLKEEFKINDNDIKWMLKKGFIDPRWLNLDNSLEESRLILTKEGWKVVVYSINSGGLGGISYFFKKNQSLISFIMALISLIISIISLLK